MQTTVTKHIFNSRKVLVLIVLLGLLLRLFGLDWDQGFHLHPDERAIVLAVVKLVYPHNLTEFLSPDSPWNPKFFAYGSFPMYLLQLAGITAGQFDPRYADYMLINIVGRVMSALFDSATIILLFFIGRKLFRPAIGLLASFFYAVSVLPIQLSHFYAVDTILTFFVTGSLYLLMLFYEKPTFKKAILTGIFFGLALATKASAIVLGIAIVAVLFIDFLFVFVRHITKPKRYLPALNESLKNTFTYGLILAAVSFVIFILGEPYALIDNKTYWEQTLYQSMMTKDAFVFPYTLQYVGKIPYLYELKNIFFFGMGPFIATFCFFGTAYTLFIATRKHHKNLFASLLPLFIFFVCYFWVVGGFAIGFMRYMLPVYPILCLFGAMLLFTLAKKLNYTMQNKSERAIIYAATMLILLIWPLSFEHIYTKHNSRYTATQWINQHIQPGQTIAIEHWDDGLPLAGQEKYLVQTLALYDPDTPEKWDTVKNQLAQTDYIIIASNRLYTPLQKLTNCAKLPQTRCYPQTAAYYQRLFSGQLGFQKVAEFTDYPTVPLLNISIDDQSADESFTVYDHPKVMIFKKTGPVNL
jgi:hypothetical protein